MIISHLHLHSLNISIVLELGFFLTKEVNLSRSLNKLKESEAGCLDLEKWINKMRASLQQVIEWLRQIRCLAQLNIDDRQLQTIAPEFQDFGMDVLNELLNMVKHFGEKTISSSFTFFVNKFKQDFYKINN